MAAFSEIMVEQYADFSTVIYIEDKQGDYINISGYSVISQMRQSPYSKTFFNFDTETTANVGEIILSMTAANTSNIFPGRYSYDIKIMSPANNVSRVVEGIVTVTPGISHGN